MSSSLQLSVIIPIYNMGIFVKENYEALLKSGVRDLVAEIIYVDDGSTDATVIAVNELKKSDEKIQLVPLGSNQGRFRARQKGAEAAKSPILLFLDARVFLPSEFARRLESALSKSTFIQPQVHIDVERNVFCLYWQRSHEFFFRKHYEAMEIGPLDLNIDNYDMYLKGTTALVAPRDLFIRACENFGNQNLLSDDTALMKVMVKEVPLRLDPSLWIDWLPRETWREFIWRLYDRGPGLVEYHVFTQRGWIFKAILGGYCFLAGLGILSLLNIGLAFAVFQMTIFGIAMTAFFLGRNWRESLRLLALHVLVVFAVGLGVIKGTIINLNRWIKGELHWS